MRILGNCEEGHCEYFINFTCIRLLSCLVVFNCRAEGKIKHCRIKREGRLFTIGTAQFESLVELVEFYMRHPLYKGMKLKYHINEDVRN